ncbi:hypothetical protein [Candidatus Clostridium radicumherbarum]|uniref:Protein kinase domain-containing protein n=1 Tax=Candidatus Clostridium radicumherbarum TaxID=3381662 RepID=A0ABW8TV51_9CLOT
MLKRRSERKHKVIKVLQFHNMKMDHYRDTKKDDCTKELEEETLEKYVKDRDSLNSKDIYNITLSICETVTNLTSLKYYIQCCQLDPSNILISKNEKIFIKDFGFSNGLLINNNSVTYLPNLVSSYVKQQSIQEDSNEKIICTIGMLMYYMATGKSMITSLDPLLEDSYGSNVDSNLKRIIQKCFHIDITRRYVSVEELKNEIIIEHLKKSKYRKTEKTEDRTNASEIAPEYHYSKRVDKHKHNNLNSIFSKISSTLSTFF